MVSGFGHFGAPRGALLIMAGLSFVLLDFLGLEAGVLNPRGFSWSIWLGFLGFLFSQLFLHWAIFINSFLASVFLLTI